MLSVESRERGFSLIELVIAIALLGIVLGTVATASVINSNESIKSQSQVKLAAALEQAVERVHLEQPWLASAGKCPTMPCQYEFEVSSSERFRFTAVVNVAQLGTDNTTYDVTVTLNAYEAGTSTLVTGLRPVRTSFIKDLRKLEKGDLIVSSCRVDQADDRMAAGSCAISRTWTPMEPPHGLPAPSPANKSGDDWLIPPFQAYGKTSPRVAWEEVRADGRDRVYFIPNSFTARVVGPGVDTTLSGAGRVMFSELPRGTYTLSISETGVAASHDFWDRKSTGHMTATNVYRVVITPGTQARVTRIWQPKAVNVTFRVKTGDAAIHWEPRWQQNSATNADNVHMRAMLVPFPEGRVMVPGLTAAEFAACPSAYKNQLNDLCDERWGSIPTNASTTTMRDVRPGLYQAYWYQSYKNGPSASDWHFRQRAIVKKDLGFGASTRWNSTFGMHGRLGYIYVHPNGDVSTGNTTSFNPGTGNTDASEDTNVSLRYPGCTSRRDMLTDLFSEVPESTLDDGSKRWVYHAPSTGKVFPPSLWDQLSPGMQARLQASSGDAALGWIKLQDRRNDSEGVRYSLYRAANGGWDDAKTKTQYRVKRFDQRVDTGWIAYPGNGHNDHAGHDHDIMKYRHQKADGTWVFDGQNFPDTAYANGRTVQWKAEHATWHEWKDWRDTPYPSDHNLDKYQEQTVFTGAGDYRTPLDDNILFRGLAGVGPTDFKVYDRCSSNDKELDADGEVLT